MEFKEQSTMEIQNAIQKIRHRFPKAQSNFFEFFKENQQYRTLATDRTVVFGREEGQIYRVFFCTSRPEELPGLLKAFPENSVMDVITNDRERIEELAGQLNAAGYRKRNVFERYSISDLAGCIYKSLPEEFQNLDPSRYGQYAEEKDAPEILRILRDTFDPKQNHLEDQNELEEMIRAKQVRIIFDSGKIAALITFRMQAKKLYMEHLVNRGGRIYSYSLYLYVLESALAKGVRYVTTWIAEDNLRSQGFAKHFGYEKEGLLDFIFVKEN